MNRKILDELKKELLSRGFSAEGGSPHDTVVLPFAHMGDVEIGDLLETMVARREKIFQSQAVVGVDAARKSYEDVVKIIDAIKTVIRRLSISSGDGQSPAE